jgi:hypothetical protein
MFRVYLWLAGACGAGSLAADGLFFDFSTNALGATPAGFVAMLGGEGQPGEWKMVEDEVPSLLPALSSGVEKGILKPVLAQQSRDGTDERCPMLVYDGQEFGDFKLTTRFKLQGGEKEQMAGIAFRISVDRYYYFVRASGLGGSFYFFKIQDGIRSAPIGIRATIPSGVWQEMSVDCVGSQIRAKLNGSEEIPELTDNTFVSGKVGFWTKSDSVSYFTDAGMTYTPRFNLAQRLVAESLELYPRLEGIKIVAVDLETGKLVVIASDDPAEEGTAGRPEERDVVASNKPYYLKRKDQVILSLPLHDRNGEAVAAVRLVMKRFPGQTEKNALARAVPIVKRMEPRVLSRKDLRR